MKNVDKKETKKWYSLKVNKKKLRLKIKIIERIHGTFFYQL